MCALSPEQPVLQITPLLDVHEPVLSKLVLANSCVEPPPAEVTVTLTVVLCESEPDVPVMVTVDVPTVAVELAVNVNTLVLVVLVGLNDAVTPLGNPEADRFTLLEKPLNLLTVTVLVPLPPCAKLSDDGEADSEKSGVAVDEMVSVTVTVCESEPDVPVIVTAFAPVVAVLLAVKVTVLDVVALAGLNDAVTPLGRPDADNATLPLNPFVGAIVIVLAPFEPCATVKLLGEADSEKSAVPVEPPASAAIKAAPFGLPQPVTRSYPVVALKPDPEPAVGLLLPLVMSWKSLA